MTSATRAGSSPKYPAATRSGFKPLRVAAGYFGDEPALVADVIEGLHDSGPVAVAGEQFHVEAFPQAFLVAFGAAEFLDVDLGNAFAQNADPLFRPAVIDNVAHVKVPADARAVEFIDVARGFERAEQEL